LCTNAAVRGCDPPAYDAHPALGWIRRGETAVLKSNHGRVNVTLNGALSWPARQVITKNSPPS
jgi:hypothetical protein